MCKIDMTKQILNLLSTILLLTVISGCESVSNGSVSIDENQAEPEAPIEVRLTMDQVIDSSGVFEQVHTADGALALKSTAGGQWLQFELPVPVSGRYRSAVIASAAGQGGTVWIEDYVDNPDGRTYNVTGEIAVPVSTEVTECTRDGSPFAAGKHPLRLHFNDTGVEVHELRFTLLRRHRMTPEVLTQEMSGDTWEIAWSDEFDGSGPVDTTKWTFDIGDWGWGNNELQYYTANRLRNARRENGNLIIEAHKNDDGHAWTSARLTTRGKVTFRYGKIELRAKVPAHRGNWAAGWTLGDAYVDELSWPYCGEIDILESVGYEVDNATGDGKAHASVHCRAFYFKEDSHHTSTLPVKDIHNTFHTYAVVWTPEGITAYVDDQPYFTYNDTTDERTWPFNEPQNIILNLAMGGGWGGAQGMDPDMPSQQYILDYVRVYARK